MTTKDLKQYQRNAKKHPEKQVKQIADSIKQFGFNVPVIIDKDNNVIAGHGRLLACEMLGITEVKLGAARAEKGANFVPVVKIDDLSPDEIKAYRLADNKLNESEWDMELALQELKTLPMELMELTGLSLNELPEEDFEDSNTEIDTDTLGNDLNIECPKCGFKFKK